MNERRPTVRHNAAENRFEATVDDGLCRLDYVPEAGVLRLVHTEVPRRLEGRGIGGALAAAAFEHARAHGLKVAAVCTYVRGWAARHPEHHDLLVPDTPA